MSEDNYEAEFPTDYPPPLGIESSLPPRDPEYLDEDDYWTQIRTQVPLGAQLLDVSGFFPVAETDWVYLE